MTWNDLADGYRKYLKSIHRHPKTIHTQWIRVMRFVRFLELVGMPGPTNVDSRHILDYQRYLSQTAMGRGKIGSVAVQNQHLSVVAGLFRYLVLAEVIQASPAAGIEYSRERKRLSASVLTEDEVKRLLLAPDLSTPVGFRDRAILEVLYSTGIRKQELMNLTMEDVDAGNGFLMIRQGKGHRDRVVPIGKMAGQYVSAYAEDIRPWFVARGRYQATRVLFLSLRGRRLGQNAVNQIVERYGSKAGLGRHIWPHCLRHAFATHLVRNRASIRHVQEMLGHAKLSTTQTYIRLTITDLQYAHRRYHPRERRR